MLINTSLDTKKAEYLNNPKSDLKAESKLHEAVYNLFDFNNKKNIEEFILNFSSACTSRKNPTIKAVNGEIDYINSLFQKRFFDNCHVSQRIKFLESVEKIDPKAESMLRIQKNIAELITAKIVDSQDFLCQEQISRYLSDQENLFKIFNLLFPKATEVDKLETLLRIIAEHSNNAPLKLKAFIYTLLAEELLQLPEANPKDIEFFTKQAADLVEDSQFFSNNLSEKSLLTTPLSKKALLSEIQKTAYFNRSTCLYNNKDQATAIYSIKYINLLSYEERKNELQKIIAIFCAFIYLKIEKEYTNQLFDLLVAPERNTTIDISTEKAVYNKVIEILYDQYYKEQKSNIIILQDGLNNLLNVPTINNHLWLKVCQKITQNIINSLKQPMLQESVIFLDSDISQLTYQEGIKKFLQNKDTTPIKENNMASLLQALFFFMKYKDLDRAEKYLEAATKQHQKDTSNIPSEIFSEIYLSLALSFIDLKANSEKTNIDSAKIEKLLIYAKNFDKYLDISSYQQMLADLFNKESSKDYSTLDNNQEIQDWIEIDNILDAEQDIDHKKTISAIYDDTAKNTSEKLTKACKRFLRQKKHELEVKLNTKSNEDEHKDQSSWYINGQKYTTEDQGVIDLGDKKYCTISNRISKKLDHSKENFYTKALEKGFVNRLHKQSGIKPVEDEKFLEIKVISNERLHNDHIWYKNPDGYLFTIFCKETGHKGIKRVANHKAPEKPTPVSFDSEENIISFNKENCDPNLEHHNHYQYDKVDKIGEPGNYNEDYF